MLSMMLFLAVAAADPRDTNLLPIPEPYRHDSSAVVITGPQEMINANCDKAPPGYHTIACAIPSTRVIYSPNPCTYSEEKDPESYAHLMCHEFGHIQGWHHVNE